MKRKREKYTKSDYLIIAKTRNQDKVYLKKLKTKKVGELKEIIGEITKDELKTIEKTRTKSKKFKKEDLKKTLMVNGLGKGSGLSNEQMLQIIEEKKITIYKPTKLDPDQKRLIELNDKKLLLVQAGPGAGKTLSLAHFANNVKQPSSILIIMFNVAAEEISTRRIECLGAKLASRSLATFNPWNPNPGIYCMTFNKFAYRIISKLEPEKNVPLGDQIPYATQLLRKNPMLNWDYVLIDEAQDIQTKLEDFTEEITCQAKHVIYMGDPRQEIITGAHKFSSLWADNPPENKFTLHYNHRSKPELIHAINEYSKECFNLLHTAGSEPPATPVKEFLSIKDQEIKKDKEKSPEQGFTGQHAPSHAPSVMVCDKNDLADAIAEKLMEFQPQDVYVVTPVTTKKFNFDKLFMSIKNSLVEFGSKYPLFVLNDDLKYVPNNNVYYVGNTKKLKGTERKNVLLVGGDIKYDEFNLTRSELVKSLFVAISRPIEKLFIYVTNDNVGKINETDPIYHIMKSDVNYTHVTKTYEKKYKLNLLDVLTVKDDLSSVSSIKFGESRVKEIKLECKSLHSPNNEDFIGLYIETLLALYLGANVNKWKNILLEEDNIIYLTKTEPCKIFLEETSKSYKLVLINHKNDYMQEELTKLLDVDLAYVLCVLNYTSQIGQWWIASKDVLEKASKIKDDLQKLVQSIPPILFSDDVKSNYNVIWGHRVDQLINCQRSKKQSCHILGIADLLLYHKTDPSKNTLLEIKYARHKDDHLRQLAIYAGLLNDCKQVILVNLLEQTYHTFNDQFVNMSYLPKWTRATLALRNAKNNSRFYKKLKLNEITGAVLVSLDLESDGLPLINSNILETGAIAWYFGNDQAESIFWELSPAVSTNEKYLTTDPAFLNELLGLKWCDRSVAKEESDKLKLSFNKWYNSIYGRKIGLSWGVCDDFKAIGTHVEKTINVEQLYKDFLLLNDCERKGNTKLHEAVEHLFPTFPIAFHRAFDDALATVLLFNMMVDYGTTL